MRFESCTICAVSFVCSLLMWLIWLVFEIERPYKSILIPRTKVKRLAQIDKIHKIDRKRKEKNAH